jgi:predicted enzyme related to lactoylglutathione lyase
MAGRLVHFEIPAEDTARAQEFYEQLFGWSFQTWGGPVEYRMTQAGGDPGGAIYKSEGRPPGPIVYFDTDDIDAHVARVRELGGRAEDKMPIPGVGWMAACHDTEGNEVRLFQSDESAPHAEG